MSGAQTYAGPNVLYDPLMASRQSSAENVLMQQQQNISEHQIEMGARLASTLLDPTVYPTTEARAAAYPSLVANARRQYPGYFTNAPDTYPGDEPTRVLARMGTPSADLYAQGIDRGAKGAIAPEDGGTTATGGTGGGGGSTGTVGGADTAPINAAGDSRTRKAAEGGPPAAGTPSAQVAQQVHDFWIGKGFSEAQVAGIMAGGPGSESDFTPTVFGDKGTSYGLYQHHGPRLDAMRQFFGLSGSQNPTADQQNQYAHWEITQGPLKNVGAMLNNAKTPAEAAAIWTQYFGVPADKTEIGRRAAGAQRFVGLYGQPQQGGPGGAPAATVPPGVQMGGDAPPPPGGAPGAYGGGGFGAVVARPPVVGTSPIPAGRPTGPPVVTDQPAGSGVVAGPPGVATVGAPQPPGPAVAGNVDAINAGRVRAGGQPAADPYATPARYAGTAPALSVEAPPETGWGAQVGSGYGPQNALAPAPVPPAPTRPAAPAAAQPAAQQPPAADTLPPLPAPTPPAPTNRNGLNAAQQQDINNRRGMPNVSADELQKRVDSYVATNAAVAEKYQQDYVAYVREMRERQTTAGAAAHQTLEEQRQAEATAATAAERARVAAREAKQDDLSAARWKAEQDKTTREVDNPFGDSESGKLRYILSNPTSDPKSPSYHAAWAAYANPQTVNGVTMPGHVMTPFRMPLDADGVPVTTYDKPAMTLAPGDLTQYRKITEQSGTLSAALDEFAKTAKGASLGERLRTVAGGSTDLRSSWTNLAMLAKGDALYQLGVLSGPDMEVIRGALADPSTFMGSLASNETIDKQVGRIKKILATRLDQARESYLPGVKPTETKPSETPTNQPLANTKIKVDLNGNVIP